MVSYIIRRLLWAVVSLIIVSFVVFLIFYVMPPGDPAALRAGHFANPQLIAEIRHTRGLDKPFWVQYWDYIRAIVLHFDFGYSYQYSESVKALIVDRLPPTISLTVGAVVIWMGVGLAVGVISAIRRRSLLDRLTMIAALLAISAPTFWLALVALFLFSKDIGAVHVFDGAGTYVGLTADPGRWFGSLLLPWLVLAAGLGAFYARLLRAQLIEAMSQDYIRTARAKGLPERRVIWHHGVRAASTPVVTALGIDIGFLLGGAVLVETVFNVPGSRSSTRKAVGASFVRDQLGAFRQALGRRRGGSAARAEKAEKRAAAKAHHAALRRGPDDVGPSGRPFGSDRRP